MIGASKCPTDLFLVGLLHTSIPTTWRYTPTIYHFDDDKYSILYGPIVPLHVKPSIQGAREGVLSTVSDGHLHMKIATMMGKRNTHQHCQH